MNENEITEFESAVETEIETACDEEEHADANGSDEEKSEVEALKNEVARLRAELEGTRALADEMSEFHALYPDTPLDTLPDEVRASMGNGIPLAAAYALYEKKRAAAQEVNRRNALLSCGTAGKNTPSEYFSPDEVRSMSQSDVRANYKKIIESMKKWN